MIGQLPAQIVRAPLSMRTTVPSSITIRESVFLVPMMEQRFAPVENATHERMIYPLDPSGALIASLEMRRDALVGTPSAGSAPSIPRIARTTTTMLTTHLSEIKR